MNPKGPVDMGSLTLQDVSKQYSDVVAVSDMNLDIKDGEFITLVGPSGCGKSTTLKMIGGLTKPSQGQVHIANNDVTNLPPKDRNLAMVFQNIALFPHMDVFDNISYGLRIRGEDDSFIEQQVNEAVDILKLKGMLDRMPSELSGGQRQRVAIGRAIVRDPEVFLMDEPLANLDAKLRVHMRTELQRIQRKLDVTTVYVTHDQEEAMTMSDRVAIINEGKLQQIDPPLVCYKEPINRFVAGFIGSPSMNFIDGRVSHNQFESETLQIDLGETEVDLPSDMTVGVRPEDIYLRDKVSDSKMAGTIQATVDVTEPTGESVFVYLSPDVTVSGDREADEGISEDSLLMTTDPDEEISENDEIIVTFDRASVHLFDRDSGKAVLHGLENEPTPTL